MWRLRPVTFSPPIVAAFAARFGGFGGLTVETPSGWLASPASGLADLPTGRIVDRDQCPIGGPLIKLIPDGLPCRERGREHPPLAAGTGLIQQRIHDVAQTQTARSPTKIPLGCGSFSKEGFQNSPLIIR